MEDASALQLLLYEPTVASTSARLSFEGLERACADRLDAMRLLQVAREQRHHEASLRVLERWESTHGPEADVASHLAMRLHCCFDEDRSAWLIRQETQLLKMRLALHFDQASLFQLMEHIGWSGQLVEEPMERKTYYEIPFEHVPDLVATRQVTLVRGIAHVQMHQLASPVVSHFKRKLSKQMSIYARAKPMLLEATPALNDIVRMLEERWKADLEDVVKHSRFMDIVTDMGLRLKEEQHVPRGKWSPTALQRLDGVAEVAFPLCARRILKQLRQTHHAKFQARFQLTLFLKGAGLPVESAIAFWKEEINQGEMKEFKKEFLYSVRHSYGLEGSRVNYTPHSCHSLLEKIPGHDECHGCPFRAASEEANQMEITRLGVSQSAATRIVGLASQRRYRQACAELFQERYGTPLIGFPSDENGTHSPLQYLSQALHALDLDLSASDEDLEASMFQARNKLGMT